MTDWRQAGVGAAAVAGAGGAPAGVEGVVRGIERGGGAGEGKEAILEAVVAGRRVGKEAAGICEGLRDEGLKAGGSVAVAPGGKGGEADGVKVRGAPIEGTDDAIGVARGEASLPTVHPARVDSRHEVRISSLTRPRP